MLGAIPGAISGSISGSISDYEIGCVEGLLSLAQPFAF
jgi:hypothetical protein